uniref:Uncharacterized protein n=1 Tax=Periophthalmus magnuspinnatus TaxID=409849 RepID=A0A3B4AYC1_9GOBI
MSAGTVVIAGAVLAAVILLTIVGVLCLCRLQVQGLNTRGRTGPAAAPRRPLLPLPSATAHTTAPHAHARSPSASSAPPAPGTGATSLCTANSSLSAPMFRSTSSKLLLKTIINSRKNNKLELLTMREVSHHSVSTDV